MPVSLNVLGKPLQIFSTNPMTGFFRNGFCDTGPSDYGKHVVAAQVTSEFLEFSKRQGNDLTAPAGLGFPGLTPGCKWCLCVSRWKEALMSRKDDDDPIVPKVFLHATHQKALTEVSMEDLVKFEQHDEWAQL